MSQRFAIGVMCVLVLGATCARLGSGWSSPPHLQADTPAATRTSATQAVQVERRFQAPGNAPYVADHILIQFDAAQTPAQRTRVLASLGAAIDPSFRSTAGLTLLRLPDGVSVAQALRFLAGRADVVHAEVDLLYHAYRTPNDPSFSQQWALAANQNNGAASTADIDALAAWDQTTDARAVVIGVIDTGIDYTHPDLIDNLWVNPAETPGDGIDNDGNGWVDDMHGINAIQNSGSPLDDDGHGTHVAGIIGARGDNDIGVTGVLWQSTIVSCKFLASNGSGRLSDALKCMDYFQALHERGVNLVATNNSWGGGGSSSAFSDAIARHAARGIIFVAAAGNSSQNNDTVTDYPSGYNLSNVVAVAATTYQGELASYSNFGATSVDIAAPGSQILSTLPGGSYGYSSGTSMAAPFVTGALGLIKAHSPQVDMNELLFELYDNSNVDPVLGGRVVGSRRLALNLRNIDSDDDGMPDPWEITYGFDRFDPSDGARDADSDGLTNREEYENDTHPLDADSDDDGLRDGDEVNVHTTDPNRGDTDGDGLTDAQEVNEQGSNPLVRDTDGDGLLDGIEANDLGTSPVNADSDGDGLSDGWEIDFGFDPTLANDTSVDADNDGLTLIEEFSAGTNPTRGDTDEDGLTDGFELNESGTDPLRADTDGDRMPDGFEASAELDPLNANDALSDADGDGFSNLVEYERGTNPQNPMSFPPARSWSTLQGNPRQSGHTDTVTPVEFFETLWTRTLDTDLKTQFVAARRDLVFAQTAFNPQLGQQRQVISLSLADGTQNWTRDIVDVASADAVHLSDTLLHVPVASFGPGGASVLGLDPASGATVNVAARAASELYSAMVADADRLFAIENDSLVSVNIADGTVLWSTGAPDTDFFAATAPATFGGRVFVADGANLHAFDRSTGLWLWTEQVSACNAFNSNVAIDENGRAVFSHADCLVSFDLATRSVLWSVDGAARYPRPSVDDQTVFVSYGNAVVALDATTGTQQWQWSVPSGVVQSTNMISTVGQVFVPLSNGETVALDRASGLPVWSYPDAGDMAISNSGALIINDNDTLSVINLEGDTDGDGMPNWWERFNGLDFVDASDADLDADNDDVTNLAEFLAGLNPADADSDDDQLSDGRELYELNTDPLNADTDGDGLLDGIEVLVYGSDPLLLDSDGDGLDDGAEVNDWGTDPADPLSIPEHIESYTTSFETGLPTLWISDPNGGAAWQVSAADASDGNFSLISEVPPFARVAVEWTQFFAAGELTFDLKVDGNFCCPRVDVYVDDVLRLSNGPDAWERFGFAVPRGLHTIRFALTNSGHNRRVMLDNVEYRVPGPFAGSTRQILMAHENTLAQYSIDGTITRYPVQIPGAVNASNVIVTDQHKVVLYDAPRLHILDPVSGAFSLTEVPGWVAPEGPSVAALDSRGDYIYAADYGEQGGLLRFTPNGVYVDTILTGTTYGDLALPDDGFLYGWAGGGRGFHKVDLTTLNILSEMPLNTAPRKIAVVGEQNRVLGLINPRRIAGYNPTGLRNFTYAPPQSGIARDLNVMLDGTFVTGGYSPIVSLVDANFENYSEFSVVTTTYGSPVALGVMERVGVDTDSDGMPDWWETQNGLAVDNAADATGDADADGLSNIAEFRLGSISSNPDTDGDGLSDGDEWLLHASNPFNPDSDGDGLNDFVEVTTYGTDPLQSDSDGDGLDDYTEAFETGTDPTLADTDGDSINDLDELNNGLNPNDASDALADPDGDGLGNIDELLAGSQIGNADSDDDGLSDGDEVNIHGTSPVLADTDDDRLPDGLELAAGFDPVATDDGPGDADADGFSNLVEFFANSDMLNVASTPTVEPWTGYQGGATHSAYLPVQLDISQLTPLWSQPLPDMILGRPFDQVAIRGARAIAIARRAADSADTVLSLNTFTGDVQWTQALELRGFDATTAAIGQRSVFVQTHGYRGRLIELDATRGALIRDDFEASIGGRILSPVTSEDAVLVYDESNRLRRYSQVTGELMWQSVPLSIPPASAPALNDELVYVVVGGEFGLPEGLAALDYATGNIAWTIADDIIRFPGSYLNAAPVVGGDDRIYMRGVERVAAYDAQRRTVVWSSERAVAGMPVFANGVLFVVSGVDLLALDSRDGNILWSWRADEPLNGTILATIDHVFVSTTQQTFAINVNTQTVDWSHASAGRFALGDSGVLLLSADNGELQAFKTYADEDADGIADDWERANGLDPLVAEDAVGDVDNDGLNNLEEFWNQLDPNDSDSDDDTLTDGQELNVYNTDPRAADTDRDGLSDGEEITSYDTNPLSADSDDDGLTDLDEVQLHLTNPNVADTDGDGALDAWEIEFDSDANQSASRPQTLALQRDSFESGALSNWVTSPDASAGWAIATDPEAYVGNQSLMSTIAPAGTTSSIRLRGFFEEGALSFLARSGSCSSSLSVVVDGEHITGFSQTYWRRVVLPMSYGPHTIELSVNWYCQADATARRSAIDLMRITGPDADLDGIPDARELEFALDPMDAADAREDIDNDQLSNVEEFDFQTLVDVADTDADTMIDGWEVRYRLNPLSDDGSGDLDNDTLTNKREFELGTAPNNTDSDYDTMPDAYEVQVGLDATRSNAGWDDDNDGLTNLDEFTRGTQPLDFDTDADGMWDGWEVRYAFDPFTDESAGDADTDALSNGDEFILSTNPRASDSDSDGMPDGYEVTSGLNVLIRDGQLDLDVDGLTNLDEFQTGTAPNNADSEGDGMDDGWEVSFGLDPLANDSGADPDGDGYSNLEEFSLNQDPTSADPPPTPVTPPVTPPPAPVPAPGGGGGGGSAGIFELLTGLYFLCIAQYRRRRRI